MFLVGEEKLGVAAEAAPGAADRAAAEDLLRRQAVEDLPQDEVIREDGAGGAVELRPPYPRGFHHGRSISRCTAAGRLTPLDWSESSPANLGLKRGSVARGLVLVPFYTCDLFPNNCYSPKINFKTNPLVSGNIFVNDDFFFHDW
jgi:hypothetical protein